MTLGRGDAADICTWTLKKAIVTFGEVSLSVGDLDSDAIDDLVIGDQKATVYFGGRQNMLDKKIVLRSEISRDDYRKPYYHYKTTVFREGDVSFVAASCFSSGNNDPINIFRYDGNGGFEITSKAPSRVFDRTKDFALHITNLYKNIECGKELVVANGILFTSTLKYSALPPLERDWTLSVHDGIISSAGNVKVPNEAEVHFTHNKQVYTEDPDFKYYYIDDEYFIYCYDYQVVDLNCDGGKQTVFYKVLEYDGGTVRHYQSAFTPYLSTLSDENTYVMQFDSEMRVQRDKPTCFAVVNSDNDTSYMSYTGKHWFEYTDPQVLTVLSSPPYFKDLLNQDGLSSGYARSETD